MAIAFDEKNSTFFLNTPNSTYIIRLFAARYILHGGWFNKIKGWTGLCTTMPVDRAYAPVPEELHGQVDFSLDSQQCEYPNPLRSDFRSPAYKAREEDGNFAGDLFYTGHKIYSGKKKIQGLPQTYIQNESEADTLEIYAEDPRTKLEITLVYTVWNSYDAICHHAEFKNAGNRTLTLTNAMSASLDFGSSRYKMLQLSGAHARERCAIFRDLVPGTQSVQSRRTASSHQQNPFIALAAPEATEASGEVFAFNLVYSGSFYAGVEVDQFSMARVQIGLNPEGFEWELKSGGEFVTPEAVMVRSAQGFGRMSRTFHDLYRKNLVRGPWRDKERPIAINNWEATYFNFDAEKLFALANTAAGLGVELFVLDDGWFGKRNDDRSSLGDWFVNKEKLPNGLEEISEGIHKMGMLFGLWFEPEMISPQSELFKAHPDWVLGTDGLSRSFSRHQWVLDLSRDDVVEYLAESVSKILKDAKVDYVKWDFNRNPTEVPPAKSHRYYLGLYKLLEKITQGFPNILFESCAGGGGRFDPGMLYYMQQTWTSDNTDALSRVQIQAGTSLAYPASAMSCHVSAIPNHQVGRLTTLSQRAHVAMAGTFGYELDFNKLNPLELAEIKEQIEWYKKIRSTVQFGDLFRLESPWTAKAAAEASRYSAWEHISKDKKAAVVTVAWTYAEGNPEVANVRLQGLEEDALYTFKSLMPKSVQAMLASMGFALPDFAFQGVPDGAKAFGSELMNAGLRLVGFPQYGGSITMLLTKD